MLFEKKLGASGEYNFFVTSHGKGTLDHKRGAVKIIRIIK